jgi:hypothetical protein
MPSRKGVSTMVHLLCLLLLLIPVTAFPFQNEPTGFRNIPWDSPINRVAGLRPVGEPAGPVLRYMKMDETFLHEGITLTEINYVAEQGRFIEAVTQFDCEQYGSLMKMLKKKYGAATTTRKGGTTWSGKVTTVTLGPTVAAAAKTPSPTAEPQLCTLTYSSTPYLRKNAPRQKGK